MDYREILEKQKQALVSSWDVLRIYQELVSHLSISCAAL